MFMKLMLCGTLTSVVYFERPYNWNGIPTIYVHVCKSQLTTLKVPITTAADDIHKYFFFREKIRLAVSSESSARDSHKKSSLIFLKIKMSSAAIFVRRFKG